MGLKEHALKEFELIKFGEGDEEDSHLKQNVLELIETLANQGHSGYSVGRCVELFRKLANFELLSPLLCTNDEWNDVSDYGDSKENSEYIRFQNNRNSSVFKNNNNPIPYYLDAIVWQDPDRCNFTGTVEGITSRQYIKIPFVAKTFYVKVSHPNKDGERKIINQNEIKNALEYYAQISYRKMIIEKMNYEK